MNHLCCRSKKEVTGNWDQLKREYEYVMADIKSIGEMGLSEPLVEKIMEELTSKISRIKERMHDYIDLL